jgi:hypothetical protein
MDLREAIELLRILVEVMTGKEIKRQPREREPGMTRQDTRGLFKRNIRQNVFKHKTKAGLLKRHAARQATK